MSHPLPAGPGAPAMTAAVTINGTTLILGRMRLRQMRSLLPAIEVMRTKPAGGLFTPEQVDAMVAIVHGAVTSVDGQHLIERGVIERAFFDADIGAYDALNVLTDAYVKAQELMAPPAEPGKDGDTGEGGAR